MVYYFYNTITEKWEPVPDNNNDVEAELQDRTDELDANEIKRSWILAHQASDIKIREDGDK